VNDLDEDKNELNFDFDNMPEADMLLNGSIAEDSFDFPFVRLFGVR
jgi:hypothetical protein